MSFNSGTFYGLVRAVDNISLLLVKFTTLFPLHTGNTAQILRRFVLQDWDSIVITLGDMFSS